ncbi:exported hypothetical protein [Azospirillaceae bacterium]
MNFRIIGITVLSVLVMLIAATNAAHAGRDRCAGSVYSGGGFVVTVGDDGSYYGCNRKNECLSIAEYSWQQNGAYVWEKGNYSYAMTPDSRGYRLKVTGPSGKTIINQGLLPDASCQ